MLAVSSHVTNPTAIISDESVYHSTIQRLDDRELGFEVNNLELGYFLARVTHYLEVLGLMTPLASTYNYNLFRVNVLRKSKGTSWSAQGIL